VTPQHVPISVRPATLSKLVVVGPSPPPFHGVAVMTLELIAALDELDALAGHLDTRDPRPVATIGRLDPRNVLLGLKHSWQLHRLLRRVRGSDVCVPISQGTWGFLRDAVLVAVARAHGRKVFLHLHGGHLNEFFRQSKPPLRAIIRLVLAQAHQAWALTPALCSQFDGFVTQDRVRCIENVVPDALPDDATRRSSVARRFRLLFLSNLHPQKGVFDLVAALRELGAKAQGWEVRLVGEVVPQVEQRLLGEIARLPIGSPTVSITGPRYDLNKLAQYAWADAFVFPTAQDEGQPLVLLEAMSAGLPIVATRHAGIEDTIRHGREGLLVRRHDVHDLAASLALLARDRDLRDTLSSAARKRYECRYRPARLVCDIAEALEQRASPSAFRLPNHVNDSCKPAARTYGEVAGYVPSGE
jgi:glycosyltransferase involved in cell wall biosynthesis